jgi:hypothetical protein
MTGGYIELQINGWIISPIIAFRKYIFRDMLPVFSNLDRRAEEVAAEHYHQIEHPIRLAGCRVDVLPPYASNNAKITRRVAGRILEQWLITNRYRRDYGECSV